MADATGTLRILSQFDSGYRASITFSDCTKYGFIPKPSDEQDWLKFEVENQPNMPFYLRDLPKDWREKEGGIECTVSIT